ncbi:hypothetical protein ABIE85_002152 [Bradyrhizobium diazoefficiens]|uniref:hypothetical protein n=1 Tax=Bradyrhizobium diazoefficiens TaxID=1355477 RepID=UPI0034957015
MASKANLVTFDRLLPTGIGLDQARVDGKSFTADLEIDLFPRFPEAFGEGKVADSR